MTSVQALFTDTALPFFNVISDAGTGPPFFILLLVCFLVFGTKVGLRAGLCYSAASYATFALKWMIAAPRPYFVDPTITAHSLSTGYGMPSGHAAQTSAGLWPVIAARPGALVSIVLVAFVLLVALSRGYLGVHYPAQVIAGLALGTVIFAVAHGLEGPVCRWLASRGFVVQLAFVMAPLVIGFLLDRAVISAFPEDIPATWQTGYNQAVEARGAQLGFAADSPEVTARQSAFTLTEPRSAEFYAGTFGFLLVALAALRFGTFTVANWRHGLGNFALGGALIAGLFGVVFVALDSVALQWLLIAAAPMICAYGIPLVTARWWPSP